MFIVVDLVQGHNPTKTSLANTAGRAPPFNFKLSLPVHACGFFSKQIPVFAITFTELVFDLICCCIVNSSYGPL